MERKINSILLIKDQNEQLKLMKTFLNNFQLKGIVEINLVDTEKTTNNQKFTAKSKSLINSTTDKKQKHFYLNKFDDKYEIHKNAICDKKYPVKTISSNIIKSQRVL